MPVPVPAFLAGAASNFQVRCAKRTLPVHVKALGTDRFATAVFMPVTSGFPLPDAAGLAGLARRMRR